MLWRNGISPCFRSSRKFTSAIEGVKEAVAGGQMVPTVGGELANIGSQLGLTSGGVGTALSEPALSKAVSDVENALRKMGERTI